MSELEHQSALSRRVFLVGLAGAAVTFGLAPAEGAAEGSDPFEPTIWYSVDRDGIVTVNITRAEMGQHIGTAVARILADELEVDWSNVRNAIMMRTQQAVAAGGAQGYLPPEHFDQIFSAHGTIMIFFVAMPLVIGLMNFAVPLQLGIRDVAFPTLNSVSLWLTESGILLTNVSLVVGEFASR